jgi:membrane protein CcdC involved in cytochrome C biogenesis
MNDSSYLVSGLATLLAAAFIFAWRMRETGRPVSTRTILIPPIGMSTGFSMFLVHDYRISWIWAFAAFASGALLLAVPLMRSTTMTRHGDTIVMQRSRTFIGILLGLVALRLLLRNYVAHILPARQTAGVFFILAFGMIVRWRTWMWLEYQKLAKAGRQWPVNT